WWWGHPWCLISTLDVDYHPSVYLLSCTLQSSQRCCSQGKIHLGSQALPAETIPRTAAGTGIIFFACLNTAGRTGCWQHAPMTVPDAAGDQTDPETIQGVPLGAQGDRAETGLKTRLQRWPKDCSEVPTGSPSGIYIIKPRGLHYLLVYCEMNVTNGGWTVIQRNKKDTPVTWAESWSTYKYGFGNVRSEYWLGTEYIYQIAKQKVYQVKFVIQDATNTTKFADYNLFSVEDESHGYRLRLGSYTGTAGDAMTSDNPNKVHDNMKFSTKDRDQDTYSKNCAYSYEGGWWYSACYSVRLNFKGGMTWGSLCTGNFLGHKL
uniref:Fibrinogen C-terminal domain-containing protein n=1 Tax=Apteryx owenii TaxID=8824 RepID=A0A8B9Q6E7_APTOW